MKEVEEGEGEQNAADQGLADCVLEERYSR